jgi:RNA polymerase sigma-70 factor (ECF subfamily)
VIGVGASATEPRARTRLIQGWLVTESSQPHELAHHALDNLSAFHAFYRMALPRIYGYLYRRCGVVAVAEDLTQDTFMVAVAQINAGNAAVVSVPWLLGVARHKLIGWFRTQDREERKLSRAWTSNKPTASQPWEQRLDRDDALTALAELPAAQRSALVLRYFDDLAVPDVARALGKSVHATESLLARGRDGLRSHYRADTEDE